ncbi:hypothetical protein PRUPE_6G110100 [Prunus persica]|uniref:TIR domain-containing protein n=1 Tax=Prunus persica TaxID=3760 RepID=M5WMJ0_PRUPE|nr:hypothetical protein PRUPE_6G110100 [Prunus persica]
MAFSSQRASTSAPSASQCKYQVFLSFRGIDTRRGFTAHLYDRLWFRSITTFRDDNELKRGTTISPNLLKAIEESWFAIVILSPNYASSTWCLDEVSKIVECMKTDTILPVFYDVDPSDVRKQMGTFEEAFNKHKKNFKKEKEKIRRWRAALTKIGNIAGWTLKDRDESDLIKEIVEEVCNKVHPTILTLPGSTTKLVGIDFRLKKIELLLDREAKDVRFIGIWGDGGTGKTTIARLVYERISHHFDVSYFLANVREVCATHGVVHLQKQLLSPILKQKVNEVWDVHSGATMTKYCLCNKKVLLVIDDADQLNQLDVLAGKKHWFGLGSRIIITTRKEHLLIEHHIEERYKLLGLQDSEDFHPHRRDEFEGDLNFQLPKKLPNSIEDRKYDEPTKVQSKNDEQVGKVPHAVEQGVNMDSPPKFKVCVGCKRNIEHEEYKDCKGTHQWHPHCFRCHACDLPITGSKFSMHENHPYHMPCYRERHLRCGVCENLIPSNSDGNVESKLHPISLQRSCPSHEDDGTPRCCCCGRIKPRNTIYYLLNDGRHQCLECRDSAITEASECEALFLEIQKLFDLKFQEKNILIHFVEETEFLKRPEVRAIKIRSGLPRLATGYVMARTMMLAWLEVKCYRIRNMSPQVKIDMSHVLAHMWLEFVMNSGSDFEKKLGNSYQRRIESDRGERFSLGRKAVLKHGLRQTLDHIAMTGSFPLV